MEVLPGGSVLAKGSPSRAGSARAKRRGADAFSAHAEDIAAVGLVFAPHACGIPVVDLAVGSGAQHIPRVEGAGFFRGHLARKSERGRTDDAVVDDGGLSDRILRLICER